MPDNTNLECASRAVAGHYALRIYATYGQERGADVLRGMIAGVLMAAASVLGWDETRRIVDDLDTRAHLPPPGVKPHLVIVNNAVTA